MNHKATMTVDVMRWPRLSEVYNYAVRREIGLEEAVQELVNKGLSHD